MERSRVVFGLASVAALFGALAACSSSTSGDAAPPAEAGAREAGLPDGGAKDATPGDTSTPGDPDKACGAMATRMDCGLCCVGNHMTGYKTFQDSLLGCACKGTGADGGAPCATDCAATACKTPPAQSNPTCDTCLQTSVGMAGACQASVVSACTGDQDCLAEQKCVMQCQGKP